MKSLYDIPAPAKLNLFLHIVGRRPDGYHLLESAFMLIDWCDTLHFDLRSDGQISREDLGAALPADDLVLRAARALKTFSGTALGAHIAIDKQIPSQAGMGGGSSDAASTLLALNRLWQLKLGLDALLPLGLALGADVPFFLGGRNAWVSGIGEKTSPIDLPPAQFLVVKPSQGLETQRIFSDPDLKRDTESAILAGFIADAYGFGRNDLQAVAERICPAVPQALDLLKKVGLECRMTGSGSAVFAKTAVGVNVETVPGFQVRQCNNLQRHPLFGWAA
jgi:4-diphosphocytidyl-2-C-methyl-D-erythritol kinase